MDNTPTQTSARVTKNFYTRAFRRILHGCNQNSYQNSEAENIRRLLVLQKFYYLCATLYIYIGYARARIGA